MGFDVDKYLEKAYKGEFINALALKVITSRCAELMAKEENVRRVRAPISLVGDIHGQFHDLLELFRVGGFPPHASYIFLGDYVDRGHHSVEVVTLLALLKIKYPERITMIRGNHETRALQTEYGFYVECEEKFGSLEPWQDINNMFDNLPIAAVVEDSIFCVHGGLSPSIERLSDISEINRFKEIPREGAFSDMMWSDPNPIGTGFSESGRGAGYLFGSDIVDQFLMINGLDKMARAHQLCQKGYKVEFEGKVITVWSAPNYTYRLKNLASVCEIDEELELEFNLFSWSEENNLAGIMNQTRDLGNLGAIGNYFT